MLMVLRTENVEIGSILDSVVGKRLKVCPYFRKFINIHNIRCWSMCSLDESYCFSRGRRLKFSSYGIDSLRVIWVCPKRLVVLY